MMQELRDTLIQLAQYRQKEAASPDGLLTEEEYSVLIKLRHKAFQLILQDSDIIEILSLLVHSRMLRFRYEDELQQTFVEFHIDTIEPWEDEAVIGCRNTEGFVMLSVPPPTFPSIDVGDVKV